jgi:polysaccharide biosynthesis protein PslH
MRILIVSPVPTHPTTAGNRARIRQLIAALGQLGHDVHFCHVNFETGDDDAMRDAYGAAFHPWRGYTKPFRKQRLAFSRIPLPDRISNRLVSRGLTWMSIDHHYDFRLTAFLSELQMRNRYEAVIVEYVFFSRALDAFPDGCIKVLDLHDIFADRHRLLARQGIAPDWFYTTRCDELTGFRRAQVVLAIQHKEAAAIRCRVGMRPIVAEVGHLSPPEAVSPEAQASTVGVVASDNLLNVQGIDWLIHKVWPQVLAVRPDAELHLFGGACHNPLICEIAGGATGVRLRGLVDRVVSAYEQIAVFANPMQAGTGLKIKTVEALCHGRPVITTPCGAEGLDPWFAVPAMRVAVTATEFAAGIEEALKKPATADDIVPLYRRYHDAQLNALQAAIHLKT